MNQLDSATMERLLDRLRRAVLPWSMEQMAVALAHLGLPPAGTAETLEVLEAVGDDEGLRYWLTELAMPEQVLAVMRGWTAHRQAVLTTHPEAAQFALETAAVLERLSALRGARFGLTLLLKLEAA